MRETVLARFAFETELHPAGLEFFRVGTTRDFEVLLLAWSPNFQVVGLRAGKAKVSRGGLEYSGSVAHWDGAGARIGQADVVYSHAIVADDLQTRRLTEHGGVELVGQQRNEAVNAGDFLSTSDLATGLVYVPVAGSFGTP